jgi:hypothetical protein
MKLVSVKNSVTRSKGRDDARFYLPRKFNSEKYGTIKWCKLLKMADIPSSTITAKRFPDKLFSIINLEDVDEMEGEIARFHQIKGAAVKGGKRLLQSDDVIFARIEPSIFNRKYAIVPPELDGCLASTEFLIARPRRGVNSVYLHWALRGPWISEQLDPGILTGSTGRRRLSPSDFSKLLIPEASEEEQMSFSIDISTSRKTRKEYLDAADNVISEADEKVIKSLYEATPYEGIESFDTNQMNLLP